MIELIVKYGVPGAVQIYTDWVSQPPSQQDIEDLRKRVPHPDHYLGEEDD